MRATSSWCKPLLRYPTLLPTQLRTCVNVRPILDAPRGISFTAVRSAARRTPATAPKVPADVKGKGKETVEADTAGKLVDGLPFLPRPLGVHERPSTVGRSWREDMMDQETRMDHRKKLVKEATKGYFADLNATRRHGGKKWIAPPVLIREDKSLYLPDISGTPLDSPDKVHTTDLCLGKVSVISMLSSKISEIQCKMYVEPTVNEYNDHAHFQHIQINLQENPLKSMLVSFFASNIKKTLPKEQWGRYLISGQNMDYIREELALENRHIAYVYLVDTACRIRWAACGDPQPQEINSLNQCTSVLLKRLTL